METIRIYPVVNSNGSTSASGLTGYWLYIFLGRTIQVEPLMRIRANMSLASLVTDRHSSNLKILAVSFWGCFLPKLIEHNYDTLIEVGVTCMYFPNIWVSTITNKNIKMMGYSPLSCIIILKVDTIFFFKPHLGRAILPILQNLPGVAPPRTPIKAWFRHTIQ